MLIQQNYNSITKQLNRVITFDQLPFPKSQWSTSNIAYMLKEVIISSKENLLHLQNTTEIDICLKPYI